MIDKKAKLCLKNESSLKEEYGECIHGYIKDFIPVHLPDRMINFSDSEASDIVVIAGDSGETCNIPYEQIREIAFEK